MHDSAAPDWHHCHFQVNFRKFIKDDAHELHGARKVILKWFKDDPSYVREPYCFDLFRRAGVWTGVHSAYCKLYIHVGDDPEEAYFGIYNMIEPIDDEYLKVRKEELGGKKDGFLWKCRYGTSLNSTGADFGADRKPASLTLKVSPILGSYLTRGLFKSILSRWKKKYKCKIALEEVTDFTVLQNEFYDEKGVRLE